MWAIWHAKRKAIHEDIYQSPLSTKCFVDRYIEELEFLKKQQPKEKSALGQGQSMPRWIPPLEGMTKINVDASISKNMKVASDIAIARDVTEQFVEASAMVVEGISGPETMEILSCREGLALASDVGLQNFRLACDSINEV
jgi:hypothetical protein